MNPTDANSWVELLSRPVEKSHIVQIYRETSTLRNTVSHYLSDGFRNGESAAVIATKDHWSEFRKGLKDRRHDPERLEREGRLAVLDARSTLDGFMRQGMPVEALFHETIAPVLKSLSSSGAPTIRAYGEMVSLLWNNRQYDAAVRLEELWNELAESLNFSLLCAYQGDALAPEFHGRTAQGVFQQHSHMVPAEDYDRLSRAVSQAMDEVLGRKESQALRHLIEANKRRVTVLPGAQATLLWLQSNLPDQVNAVLAAARRLTSDPKWS